MKISRLVVLFIAAAIIFGGCSGDKKVRYDNYASQYELRQSTAFAYQFERAILYVNPTLPDTFRYRLVPTWPTSILSPRFSFLQSGDTGKRFFRVKRINDSVSECMFYNYRPVPVYLVDDDKLGNSENIFIPDHSSCVLVNIRFIDTLWRDFGLSRTEPDRRHSFVLALILLHELGHLRDGDAGSYTEAKKFEFDKGKLVNLNNNKEYKADLFAITSIQSIHTKDYAGSFAEKFLQYPLDAIQGDYYRAISYGRSEFETQRDILGVFGGKGGSFRLQTDYYSHPNLYLRFLMMGYALDHDPTIPEIIRLHGK